jgi:hypothetical protein
MVSAMGFPVRVISGLSGCAGLGLDWGFADSHTAKTGDELDAIEVLPGAFRASPAAVGLWGE